MAYKKYHKLCLYGCLLSVLSFASHTALAASMRDYTQDNTGRPKVEIDLNAVHDIEDTGDVFIDHSSFDGQTVTSPEVYTKHHNKKHNKQQMTAQAVAHVERQALPSHISTEKPVIRPIQALSSLQKPVARPLAATMFQKPMAKPNAAKEVLTNEAIMTANSIGPIARPPAAVASIQPLKNAAAQKEINPAQPHPQAVSITPKAIIVAEKEAIPPKDVQPAAQSPEVIEDTSTPIKKQKQAPLAAPEIPKVAHTSAPLNDAVKDKQTARLIFEASETELTAEQKQILDQQILMMKSAPAAKMMIETYANGKEAQRISILRGFAVRIYLMDHDISYERMQFTPRGNNTDITPIDRVDLYIIQ